MKNSILMLSTFTAIKGLSIISCHSTGQKGINVGTMVDETSYLLHLDATEYKKDLWTFRQKMGKRIESNSLNLSENRTKIKKENIEANADFSTTIFEFELDNGYMMIINHAKHINERLSKRNLTKKWTYGILNSLISHYQYK